MEVIGLSILENTIRQYLKVFPGHQVLVRARWAALLTRAA